jgi:drug/metabolite transporter (DMT)-like permease
MVVIVSVASALCYGVAMVLQHSRAGRTSPSVSLRPALLATLGRDPLWLAGMAANGAGYALRFVALSAGSLVVVQPVVVASLLFAVPVSARWHGQRLRSVEWLGTAGIAAGLALFVVLAGQPEGRTSAPVATWLAAGAAVAVLAGGAVALAQRLGPSRRAPLLAVAGGLLLALTAALTRVTAAAFEDGVAHALAGWAPWALVGVGFVAILVVQSAFAAGPLSASLPVLMVLELVASVALGVTVLGEHVAGGAAARIGEAAGLALMVSGIVAGSPAVTRVPDGASKAAAIPGVRGVPEVPGVRGVPDMTGAS